MNHSRKELALLDDLALHLEGYEAIIVSKNECEVGIIVHQEGSYDPHRNSSRVLGTLSTANLRELISENKHEFCSVQKEYKVNYPTSNV